MNDKKKPCLTCKDGPFASRCDRVRSCEAWDEYCKPDISYALEER